MDYKNANTAYIIGVAIGDGNLSNSNGRAVRLRITCDNKYPLLKNKIAGSLQTLFPENKISFIKRKSNCTDISCYSNKLESTLGWSALSGSKEKQKVRVPSWIFSNRDYIKSCLCGLFETDGSIYKDREYTYANFTTIISRLRMDTRVMIDLLGYKSTVHRSLQKNGKERFTVRVSKRSSEFIKELGIQKI